MVGELEGRVALVTGGGRGIGLAIARALAGAGAKVALTGRNQERLALAAAELAGAGAVCLTAAQDVAREDDWRRVMEATLGWAGRLDIVVANAGVAGAAPIAELSLEAFRALHEINLKGAFFAVKHGAGALRRHGEGGAIVLIASILGRVSAPGYAHYSASKAGVRLLAKAAALELAPEKIRVNAILPGVIRTDMTAGFPEAQLAAAIPLQRFGEASEIAEAVLFAASGRACFMTGADLVADGGWTVQ